MLFLLLHLLCLCSCAETRKARLPAWAGFLGSVRESISGAWEAGQDAAAPLLLRAWMEDCETVFLP